MPPGLVMSDSSISPLESLELEKAIAQYEQALTLVLEAIANQSVRDKSVDEALASLKSKLSANDLGQMVLNLLMARDQVEYIRYKQSDLRSPQQTLTYLRLIELDQRLQKQSEAIALCADLGIYRQSIKPDRSSWWWFFDAPKQEKKKHKYNQFDWVWNGLTVVCLVTATSFAAITAKAFSAQGFDITGLLRSFSQGAGLTLIAGGTFTSKGRKVLQQALNSVSIPSHFHAEVTCLVSATLLLISWTMHENLDEFGERYYNDGKSFGNTAKAINAYQKALSFNPEHEFAYAGLGRASEKMGKIDDAISYYEQGLTISNVSYAFSAIGLARITLFQALSQNGWTRQIPKSKLQEVEFFLDFADHFNNEKSEEADEIYEYVDIIVERYTHLGLLELAQLNLNDFPFEQDNNMRTLAQRRLDNALDYFQQAYLTELGLILSNFYEKKYYDDSAIIRMLDTLLDTVNKNSQISDIDKNRIADKIEKIKSGQFSIYEIADILFYDSTSEENNDIASEVEMKETLIKAIEVFIRKYSEEFDIKESGIESYANELKTAIAFDLGKPRCYFAITQFLDDTLFNHPFLAMSDMERSEHVESLRVKREYAEYTACGAEGTLGSIKIDATRLRRG
ncbi:MAG: hypothetical protein F6K11_35110 [Leptolyngbya sp. SIO3F4]|nr:hypothetical protein [Leptolyngbya sp. SIO3F4]